MIRPGRMRHRLVIEEPVKLPNVLGELTPTRWREVATVWAEIRPLRSNETIRARQVQMDLTHEVTIRYFRGLTTDCRLRWDHSPSPTTRYLNITGIVDVDGMGDEHKIQAAESTGA